MSLVWDIRSRFSHLKDILFGLEAREAENSLGQHKHNLNFETMLGLYFFTFLPVGSFLEAAIPPHLVDCRGDRKTAFFHRTASRHKSSKHIIVLVDCNPFFAFRFSFQYLRLLGKETIRLVVIVPYKSSMPVCPFFIDRSPSVVEIPSLLPKAICPRGKGLQRVQRVPSNLESFRKTVKNPICGKES